MHTSAPPPRTTRLAPKQLGDQLAHRHAFRQRVPVAPVGAEDRVFRTKMGADAGGDSLLPNVGVAGTVQKAHLVRLHQLPLGAPDHEHLVIEREKDFLFQIQTQCGC